MGRRKMGNKKPLIYISAATALIIASLFLPVRHVTCSAKSTVVEIQAIHYRGATLLMSDGEIIKVNQATLKAGDEFCYKYATEWL